MAWDIPYFRAGTQFIVGLEIYGDELLVRLWQIPALDGFSTRLATYETDHQVISFDVWEELNEVLVNDLVAECLEHTIT